MSTILEDSAVDTGLEKSVFIPIPKKGNVKECSNYSVQMFKLLCSFCMLISLCSRFFKLGFNSMWTKNFQMYKLDLEKSEEPDIKFQTFIGS